MHDLTRRDFVALGAVPLAAALVPVRASASAAEAAVRPADLRPPTTDRQQFIDWMVQARGEDPAMLGARFDRLQRMLANGDVWREKEIRAYLLTPREDFVLEKNLDRTYSSSPLDIGYGVTISGPHLVGRMTSNIDVQPGERVLEVGTGSGYQSAFLSHLTDQVYTIEIIKPLAERTWGRYDRLIQSGYEEFRNITTENADGYYGWKEHAPFDKIIVTCGIDHVPPDLLRQLKPDGIMVIPIGPPGAQHVLRLVKRRSSSGRFTVSRSDIYRGLIVNFVPFTKLENGRIVGTHSG